MLFVLKASDVYHVIGYYLENRDEVDSYIQSQREESLRLRREWEAQNPSQTTKADLLARIDKSSQSDLS